MTLTYTYDGAAVTHDAAPSGLNVTHRADGEASFGGIPFEDPTASLVVVGHKLVTVEEDECAQPRLFTGFTTERSMGRSLDEGLFVGASPRLVDMTVVDMNAALGFRQITGSDGNRPAETWADRLTWILESDYLNEFISDDQTWVVTNTVSCEAADYRDAYATAVLDDLVDRSGGAYVYYAFWDAAASETRLFFDNDSETIGACTLSISNVDADVDGATVFAPTTTTKLAREPDQQYSDVIVVYDRGAKKLYRHRPSTAAAGVRRGTSIQRPYTRGLATATAQAEKWLDKHSVETDRITCSIQVPADSVGLIQAGQSIEVKLTHLGSPYTAWTTMRIVSYSPKPTNDTGYWYDVALELVYRPTIVPVDDCTTGSVEWVADGPTTIIATGANSPKTTSIPQPSAGPAVIISGLHLKNSYTSVNDYLANEITVASPWTMVESNSDPLDLTYRTHIMGVASTPWTSGAVPDIVHSWTGVYTRPGEGFVMSVAVLTDAIAPVQSGSAFAAGSDSKITLPNPPTEGNLLVLFSFRAYVPSLTGWTKLHEAYPDIEIEGLQLTTVFARCVEAGEGVDIPIQNNAEAGIWWAVSEWTVSANADEEIDLGPTPGATTIHTTDPTVDDDAGAGYTTGSHWVNETSGHEFVLVDSTTGAAVWVSTTAVSVFSFSTSDGTTTVDPTTELTFVGATLADLGGGLAEVTWSLPSGTPGGELGGTWASPTVDATHAGSTHLALGSTSSTAAAGDHTHAGVYVGELLMQDGVTSPPVPIENEAGDDWLYAD